MHILLGILIIGIFIFIILKNKSNSKPEIVIENSKIGLISLSNRNSDKQLLDSDKSIYENYYTNISSFQIENKEDLINVIQENKFDLLHLIITIDKDGIVQFVEDSSLEIKSIMQVLSKSSSKILLIASENLVDAYTNVVNPSLFKAGVVMTIDRKGNYFKLFYTRLFKKISQGKSFALAWIELAPQNPNLVHENMPEAMMALGSVNIILK